MSYGRHRAPQISTSDGMHLRVLSNCLLWISLSAKAGIIPRNQGDVDATRVVLPKDSQGLLAVLYVESSSQQSHLLPVRLGKFLTRIPLAKFGGSLRAIVSSRGRLLMVSL